MKRIVLVVLLMLLIYNVNAQIEVKDGSFNKIPNFVMDDKDNRRSISWIVPVCF